MMSKFPWSSVHVSGIPRHVVGHPAAVGVLVAVPGGGVALADVHLASGALGVTAPRVTLEHGLPEPSAPGPSTRSEGRGTPCRAAASNQAGRGIVGGGGAWRVGPAVRVDGGPATAPSSMYPAGKRRHAAPEHTHGLVDGDDGLVVDHDHRLVQQDVRADEVPSAILRAWVPRLPIVASVAATAAQAQAVATCVPTAALSVAA